MLLRLFLLPCLLSWAADGTVEQFRADAGAIPRVLLQQGYSGFGGLDLKEIVATTTSSEVRFVDWVEHGELSVDHEDFSRNSAEWTRSPDGILHIKVNRELWLKTPEPLRKVIALHEHLGPADHDYQLSSALDALASPDARAFSPAEKQEFASRISANARSGGGIIGIGGGGDEDGANTKTMMLHRDLGRLAREKNPARRRAILANMQDDLSIRSEVSRLGAGDHGLILRNAPAAVADSTRYAYACRQTLQLPPAQIENVYELLVRQSPDLREKLKSAEGLLAWCKGFLDGSEP